MNDPQTSELLADMLDDLRTLVEIESPSRDVDALATSAGAVSALLERHTGTPAELVDGPDGPHVWWRGGAEPRVLILGHHDTVFPKGALAERPFTIDDGRATGPGVFDMKGGIVLAAHAVGRLADLSAVEVLITADEEIGSTTSRAFLEERAAACGRVLVLEGAADGGALKIGRKGVGMFTVTIGGRAAHAGLEPEKGVNALVEAAHQVLAIAGLGDADNGTTVTPTILSAGTAENVVPEAATIQVDVRVTEMAEAARVDDGIRALLPMNPAATVTIDGGVNRGPMTEETSAELFALAVEVAGAAGLARPLGASVGGGSDGNFTAALGIPTLDGLGAVGGGAHAAHEWIDVDALPPRRALLTGLLAALTR